MSEPDPTGARAEVLARVRQAHAAAPPEPDSSQGIDRSYREPEAVTARGLDRDGLLELLVDRLVDYRATVTRCGPDEVAQTVRGRLDERTARRVAVAGGLAEHDALTGGDDRQWLTEAPGDPLGVEVLDGLDSVVTGSAVAVALTGTIVLDASPDQGRRAFTLVPDHHVCVVRAEDVVHGVGEALARLEATRPLTWISGPSATSDIELDRVEGVHGPRVLDVVLVGDR